MKQPLKGPHHFTGVTRDVTAKVEVNGRAESIPANWTCQKSLMTVTVRSSE